MNGHYCLVCDYQFKTDGRAPELQITCEYVGTEPSTCAALARAINGLDIPASKTAESDEEQYVPLVVEYSTPW